MNFFSLLLTVLFNISALLLFQNYCQFFFTPALTFLLAQFLPLSVLSMSYFYYFYTLIEYIDVDYFALLHVTFAYSSISLILSAELWNRLALIHLLWFPHLHVSIKWYPFYFHITLLTSSTLLHSLKCIRSFLISPTQTFFL